jgi:sterol desaturase/sphingolipid hydroxylase (fatty acid hydroxylase superfamily)
MDKNDIKNEGQGQIFQTPLLEYMTKAPAPVSSTIYICIGLVLLAVGYQQGVVNSWMTGVGIYLGALFFWTFFEYFFHRYVNHLDEYFPDSEWAHKVAYTIHGIHHEYPRDKERLIMPPIPGLLIVGALYIGFSLILGSYVYIFMPGFMTGYLLYTYVHFSVHRRRVPSWLKVQYRHHALHHYKYPDKAFGVSTTVWDRVFGTMPPEN